MSQETAASVIFSGVLWACSGGASDPLTDSCSGQYTCTTGSTSVTTTLVKQTNGCFAGEIRLGGDHTATLPSGRQGSWAGSVDRFDVCEGSDCVVCTATTPPASNGSGPISKICVSNAVDVPFAGIPQFDCVDAKDENECKHYGCITGEIAGDGGSGRFSCGGYPAPCAHYSSQDECESRAACFWQ
jgi:hypothetical protein